MKLFLILAIFFWKINSVTINSPDGDIHVSNSIHVGNDKVVTVDREDFVVTTLSTPHSTSHDVSVELVEIKDFTKDGDLYCSGNLVLDAILADASRTPAAFLITKLKNEIPFQKEYKTQLWDGEDFSSYSILTPIVVGDVITVYLAFRGEYSQAQKLDVTGSEIYCVVLQ